MMCQQDINAFVLNYLCANKMSFDQYCILIPQLKGEELLCINIRPTLLILCTSGNDVVDE